MFLICIRNFGHFQCNNACVKSPGAHSTPNACTPQENFEGHTPNVVGFLALRAFLPPRRMAIDCE